MEEVILASSAYVKMALEAYDKNPKETGGILLGAIEGNKAYVVDVVDPGPKSIFTPHYFEYDEAYVNHHANVLNRMYVNPLVVLGLWHRHPGSLDRFSATDDETNQKFARLNKMGAISAIANLDPDLRFTFYWINSEGHGTVIPHSVKDSLIPSELTNTKGLEDILPKHKDESLDMPKKAEEIFRPFDTLTADDLEGSIKSLYEKVEFELVDSGLAKLAMIATKPNSILVRFAREKPWLFARRSLIPGESYFTLVQTREQGVIAYVNGGVYHYVPGILDRLLTNKVDQHA